MRDKIPGGRVCPRRGRGDHRLNLARGEGLGNIGGLYLNRCRLGECREFFQRGIIGTKAQARQPVDIGDLAVGIKPLRRPRHRKQRHQALRREKLCDDRFLGCPKFRRVVIAGGNKGLAVNAKGQIFVREGGQEELSGLDLARTDGILDLTMREK